MGKKNKREGLESSPYSAIFLFIAAGVLLTAGWLMKSFPVLIFVGMAPLFAITDKTSDSDKFWEYAELILLALTISFFAGHFFEFENLIATLGQSIVLTLSFVGFAFCRQSLGTRVSKITIALFWLSLEYIFLKIYQSENLLFLADAIQLKTEWLNWTYYTGYLGATCWILACNLLFYAAVLREGKLNLPWMVLFAVTLAGPIIFSYFTDKNPVSRPDMVRFYQPAGISEPFYGAHGEYIPRTAAWTSLLIFTFALVKDRTKKK